MYSNGPLWYTSDLVDLEAVPRGARAAELRPAAALYGEVLGRGLSVEVDDASVEPTKDLPGVDELEGVV